VSIDAVYIRSRIVTRYIQTIWLSNRTLRTHIIVINCIIVSQHKNYILYCLYNTCVVLTYLHVLTRADCTTTQVHDQIQLAIAAYMAVLM